MADLNSDEYGAPRNWIKRSRKKGVSWSTIFGKQTDDGFFETGIEDFLWPEDSQAIWGELAKALRENEENLKRCKERTERSTLSGSNQLNNLEIPEGEDSCWSLYRSRLIKKGFTNIDSIQAECHNVLRHLSNTMDVGPVKGLVVGNVQSGKTANMAGLIAMAADQGWNFFIVLSGTIDKLRVQTRDRLYEDLKNDDCKLNWQTIDLLNLKNVDCQLDKVNLNANSNARYLTVSLKNAKRLRDVLKWVNKDSKKKKQLKLLIIDDEADQASVNTAPMDKDRKTINRLIVNLVNGKDEKGQDAGEYGSLNYVAYTATPYANFLSEGSEESLYPRDFVTLLTPPDIYFGPSQIFGFDQWPGLSIINTYENVDEMMLEYSKGRRKELPDSFKDAFCWFMCTVAIRRKRGAKKPVSMLIHTSQFISNHDTMAKAIQQYIVNGSDDITKRCRDVYDRQTSLLTVDLFKEEYPGYGFMDKVEDYPKYSEIEGLVKELTEIEPKHIKIEEDGGSRVYHRGIHICIDNSSDTSIDGDENSLPRLFYPEPGDESPDEPAFVVVGGNTLSRGLTVEGLTSTYFARDTRQGDTLMQMGRWFGYRTGYELLPRIWMSSRTRESFEELVVLDEGLRQFVRDNYNVFSPADYPPKVRTFPKSCYLRNPTSKNKMRQAVKGYDFSGTVVETNAFIRDVQVLRDNKKCAEEFLLSLGTPRKSQICDDLVWLDIRQHKIFDDLLSKFRFDEKLRNFNELDAMKEWVSKNTNTPYWDVVLATVKDKKDEWTFGDISVKKVWRGSKFEVADDAETISIGNTLSSPRDRIADVEIPDGEEFEENEETIRSEWRGIRARYGLRRKPVVIVYCIDKNSKPTSRTKHALNVEEDLVGLTVVMPGIDENDKEPIYVQIPAAITRGDE